MNINFNQLNNLYFGTDRLKNVFLGSNLIYKAPPINLALASNNSILISAYGDASGPFGYLNAVDNNFDTYANFPSSSYPNITQTEFGVIFTDGKNPSTATFNRITIQSVEMFTGAYQSLSIKVKSGMIRSDYSTVTKHNTYASGTTNSNFRKDWTSVGYTLTPSEYVKYGYDLLLDEPVTAGAVMVSMVPTRRSGRIDVYEFIVVMDE